MKARIIALFALFVGTIAAAVGWTTSGGGGPPPATGAAWDDDHHFRLTSTTFQKGAVLPGLMISNISIGSVCVGQNTTPELSWKDAPRGTKSFVVTLFDTTAGFTHWAVYNIPVSTTSLPENAGANTNLSTPFGDQTVNDLGLPGYIGPCPPSGLVHNYEFTVFALDKEHFELPSAVGFPPDAETLYRAMFDHVIDRANYSGVFSCPANSSFSVSPNPAGTCS
jgi:Raf kinase inhibitor-like YbhB/YbcL family protein